MRASMPKTIRTSLRLLIGSVVAGPLVRLVDPSPLPNLPPATWRIVLMTLFSLGVTIFLVVKTYRGSNWARWVYSLMFVSGSLLQLSAQIRSFSTPNAVTPFHLIVYAAGIVSVVLLFARSSNAWYSQEVQVLPDNSLQRP
jgi:hypothetical protein